MRNLHYAAWILLASVFAACSCGGDDPIRTGKADPRWQSSALSIEACPEGSTVANVQIQNVGTASLDARLVLTGTHADMFSLDRYDLALGIGGAQTIKVTYHPTGEGVRGAQHTAVVEVRYKAGGKDEVKPLQLVGDVSNASATPTPSIECAPGIPVCIGDDVGKLCCRAVTDQGSPVSYVTKLSLGGVPFGETSELPIVVKNLGCDPLDLEEAILEFGEGNNSCDTGELSLTAPDGVVGLGSETMTVAFAPKADRVNGCSFTGMVRVKWGEGNDDTKMPLSDRAVSPELEVNPRSWNFGDILPGNADTFRFKVLNSGTEDAEIARVAFEGASAAEFSVVKYERGDGTAISGTPFTLVAGDGRSPGGPHEAHLTVEYRPTAPPHRAAAIMVIETTGGSRLTVQLSGGKAPELRAHPTDELEFLSPMEMCDGPDLYSCEESNGCPGPCDSDADCGGGKCLIATGDAGGVCSTGASCAVTCGGATRVARFCNASTSPLSISNVSITGASGGPAPVDPLTGTAIFTTQYDECTGKSLPEGQCCDVGVNFKDKSSGGFSSANLVVRSDDPLHPDGYELLLTAFTTDNRAPTAIIDAPHDAFVEEWVRFDPNLSRDDMGIDSFRWELDTVSDPQSKLVKGPITPETLEDRCKDHFGPPEGGPCVRLLPGNVLEIYPDRAATYQVKLTAVDSCGVDNFATHRVTTRRP